MPNMVACRYRPLERYVSQASGWDVQPAVPSRDQPCRPGAMAGGNCRQPAPIKGVSLEGHQSGCSSPAMATQGVNSAQCMRRSVIVAVSIRPDGRIDRWMGGLDHGWRVQYGDGWRGGGSSGKCHVVRFRAFPFRADACRADAYRAMPYTPASTSARKHDLCINVLHQRVGFSALLSFKSSIPHSCPPPY